MDPLVEALQCDPLERPRAINTGRTVSLALVTHLDTLHTHDLDHDDLTDGICALLEFAEELHLPEDAQYGVLVGLALTVLDALDMAAQATGTPRTQLIDRLRENHGEPLYLQAGGTPHTQTPADP